MNPPIRLLLVDDHPFLLQSLSETFARYNDIEVVQACTSLEEAFRSLRNAVVDVVITDIHLEKDSEGLALINYIQEQRLPVRVLVFSDKDRPEDIRKAVALNITGYLNKRCGLTDIVRGIRWAVDPATRDQLYLAPQSLRERFFQKLSQGNTSSTQVQRLTEQEIKVLKAFGRGLEVKAIGIDLGRKPSSIYSSLDKAQGKLGLASRVALRNFSIRYLVSEEEIYSI